MMSQAFEKHMGKAVEVYVDDLVVKSKYAQQHP